ncbi:MAG TPA: TlpA disulfide reductase family protein [Phycisphaerae bacterium]|nr:TlpA disulfide reductase family protein [Phycisphaerae bacterium]
MNRTRRIAVLALAVVMMGGTLIPTIGRGAGSTPASAPAAKVESARGVKEIDADLRATSAQLQEVMPGMGFLDETVRKAIAAKAVPLLRKMVSLLGELASVQADPEAQANIRGQEYEFDAILVTFGEVDTITLLEKEAGGKDASAGVQAQSSLALGRWWANSKNAPAQLKLLADYTAVAKANSTDTGVIQTLGAMMQLGAANDDVAKKVLDVLKTNMKGEAASGLVAQAEGMAAQHTMIGKPLTVSGRTTSGGKFTSEDLKGKVVLVDFWATWCGPCNAELPRTKKLYDDYHAKGLEIVGVDCDVQDDIVNAFTKEKQMPWTQLRESTQTGEDQWHPLAKQWHVDGIPTMFLIDKKGILRYVDAREGTEEKVAALLAEGEPATQPAAK